MTTYNKTTLKTFFEQGDIPTGTNYADLIDSQINIVETGNQSMAGALTVPELITPRVSAAAANFSGDVSAANVYASGLIVAGDVSATGTVYTSALRSTNGVFAGVGIVSAAGTAQATAAVLTNVINRGKGIVDGSTTGFTPLANSAGLVQYLFNEGASANLWPPVGGTINGLAANAAFSVAASSMVTIVHLTASAMAAK
jgi:hypothetical protein